MPVQMVTAVALYVRCVPYMGAAGNVQPKVRSVLPSTFCARKALRREAASSNRKLWMHVIAPHLQPFPVTRKRWDARRPRHQLRQLSIQRAGTINAASNQYRLRIGADVDSPHGWQE